MTFTQAFPFPTPARRSLTAVLVGLLPLFAVAQQFVMAEGETFTSCAGDLFDPSGPSANYADSEVIVSTLCPTGGPDAGPLTKVLFTQWDLASGSGDHLHIYQGTEADGPPFLVGSHDNSLLGQTVISIHATGCLSFEWTTNEADNAAGWAARVKTGPDAGTDGVASSILNGPTFQLLDSLEGTPESGGSWATPGGAACNGVFDPATDTFGTYTYTVNGTSPCPEAAATLQVQLRASANAGTNGTLVLCSTNGAVDLFTSLGGTPEVGGTWTAPGGAAHSSTFDPATDTEGMYTYTVLCTPQPCTDATATVTVTVNDPPTAGSNASVSVCSNAASFDLFTSLGGSPDAGGAWTGPAATPVAATFIPGTSQQGVYTYTVLGAPPCVNATATVNVTVVTAPNAGTAESISVCGNATSFTLIQRLGGTPQAGGTWTGPGVGAHGPTFDPAIDVAGAYTYTVNGTAPCAAATAVLTIALQAAPKAGTNGTITTCSTDASFALFALLGGTPDGGGSWTAPGGAAFPGTFIPGTSAAGIYTYTVAGVPPCANATATVTVTVNTAPNAGTNVTVTRCSNAVAFNLFAQLGGVPTPGGSWVGPSGATNATFTPGTSLSGAYTYTVLGAAPCANASAVVTVTITQAPNAGVNGSTSVCTNSAPFALSGFLSGTPSPSGTWTAPGGGANNGTFTPGTSVAGTYTYTVVGGAPCANATATVAVTTVAPPAPGANGTLSICSNAANVDLFTLLGGSPTTGGTWTRPNGTAHSGTFIPPTDVGGTYTYTVNGTPPCSAASASVQVTRTVAPNAGIDGSITVCSTTAPFQLFTVLGGTPNGGGTWRTPANAAFPSGTFTPGTTPAGAYKYIVLGTAPCANDTALVAVVVNQAPNAGTNSSSSVCSNQASFNLITRLGGSPNAGGAWTGPDSQPFPGTYIPGTSLQGGYTYTVVGLAPCLAASAVVALTEQQQPVAGSNASFAACSTAGAVDLFDELNGTPDAGGSWTAPGGGANSGVFLPASSVPGIYTYTITATAPCTNAVATVTAAVNEAPDAGTDAVISVCADQATVDLFNALGGSPDTGGTWSDDDVTGQLSGQLFSPTGLPPGDYDFTHTVLGNGQCGNDVATVRVTIVAGLDAGSDGTLSVCNTNALVNLFTGLTGAPQQGGVWLDLSGTGALTQQFFNSTLVPGGSYIFRYKLNGTASCSADSAKVTVAVTTGPNAGTNGSTVACSTSAAFNLFPFLGGNPQIGGIWKRGAAVISNMYAPVTDAPGVLTYTVTGTIPCPNATATVTVTEVPASNAGTSSSTTVCSNDGGFNMTLRLGGAPQVGSWSLGGVAHSNLFQPGVDAPGVYLYTVPGQSPCSDAIATLTVTVNSAPNAGVNGSVTTCSSASSFLLISFLAGAGTGGTWAGPAGVHSGLYAPSADGPGDYFYTLTGTAPCAADVAVVTVFENDVPNAGISANVALCSNGSSVNLLTVLGGSPNPTGTWTGPAPATTPFNGLFVPGTTTPSTPGTYTYTVVGTPPCPNATSTVTVVVSQPPNAGTGRAITVCSNSDPFALVDSLGGSPALNGIWTPPPPLLLFNGFFNPASSPIGDYTYTVTGGMGCPNASATITVAINPEANAGLDAEANVCNTDGILNMFPLLGTSAQAGGNWTVQSTGATHSDSFQPSVDVSNVFVHTVLGRPGCANDIALVDVTLNRAPNAGFNGSATVCDNNVPFQLVNELSGTPQLNGTWVGPTNQAHTGTFVPGSDAPGIYTYTVAGTPPCDDATAQVNVIVNIAPDAGGNGVRSVCSSHLPFSLFLELDGSPDIGGVWYNPTGQVVGATFNPATSAPGVYKYRIQGSAPCVSDSATVTVFVSILPNAGISTVAQICSSSGPVTLVDLLGGTPGPGGTWTFSAVDHGPVFDPTMDVSGAYVYTMTGITPCPNAVAQVQITFVQEPDAGPDGDITACLGDDSIVLAGGLGDTSDAGGTWSDDDNTGELIDGVLDGSTLPPDSYHFTYTVVGVGPCDDASAVVTVVIVADLDAGVDASATVCTNELPELVTLLGGAPQSGGFWLDVDSSGALIGDFFNTPQVPENSTWRLDYVLPATSSCASDTARLTLTVAPSPFAGCDGFASFCSLNPPGGLIGSLPCGPDVNGTWYGPIGSPHSGTFVPATDLPGTHLYVVAAIGGCAADTAEVEVEVTPAPDAGVNASASICSIDQPMALFSFLGPTAQPGGVWSINNITVSGVYNPAVDVPGVYQYRVAGGSPCPADFAFVTVSEPQAPDAGTAASIQVCSNEAPFTMRNALGGLPEQGGTWTGPGPDAHDDEFDPASDVAGIYTYVVVGLLPCANDTARLTISLTPAPFTGEDSTVAACVTQTAIDLFAALGAGAQAGGAWTDIGVSGALTDSLFNPSIAGNGTWEFQYAILAAAPCDNAFSTITVVVGSGSSAGEDSVLTICGGYTAYPLINALGGVPDPGGVWTGDVGTGALLPGGFLNATIIPAGTVAAFVFTVEDAGCGDVQASVQVTISDFPDPGGSIGLTLCATAAPVDLFAALIGTPETDGVWTGPQGVANNGTFIPGTNATGPYSYTVAGNAFCTDSTAVITIVVNQPPDAGANGQVVLCDTLTAYPLITGLQGTPDAFGTWLAVDGAGGLTGSLLNTAGLVPDTYEYTYTVQVAGCVPAAAVVKVDVVTTPVAVDVTTLCNEQDRTYTVTFTIEQGNPNTYEVIGAIGTMTTSVPYTFTSTPIITSQVFSGYVRDANACGEYRIEQSSPCSFEEDVFVPESFSPNGDGINENFSIPGIEGYPNNTITIFNRWGGEVYNAAGYNNGTVVWDGTSPDALIAGNAPTGTYFYVLELGKSSEPITGFIQLIR